MKYYGIIGGQASTTIYSSTTYFLSVGHAPKRVFFLPVSLYQGGQTERLLAVLAAGWVTGLSSQREREYFMTLFFPYKYS